MVQSAPPHRSDVLYKQIPIQDTYALGVHALQRACERDHSSVHPQFTFGDGSKVYRPLTFKENIEAIVNDYETLHFSSGRKRTPNERSRLFNQWHDSCTGIATKKGTTHFKIIPQCLELITLPEDFHEDYLSIPYTRHKVNGLDSSKGQYNQPLTPFEVLHHEGWQTVVENDASLLAAFAQVVFSELKRLYQQDTGMGFYVYQNPTTDELRALFVCNLNGSSNADGNSNLVNYCSFLRVAPVVAPRVVKTISQEEKLLRALHPYLKSGTQRKAERTIRRFLK